eukprot:gnl/MRDRNA2_/MRDRNA2_96186_c0_seq1.p1 gnl/MRDRNA2_/MRDRNA2_96186_c0~~gnl/MRDRNA2_/MRDRNA2_96186_c0_seq1.p1  ORF type:complete len:501 (-),score=172.91 gnl/MRDRNA2_/MRDRNA2_96186_c0_seq1:234-1736(-)
MAEPTAEVPESTAPVEAEAVTATRPTSAGVIMESVDMTGFMQSSMNELLQPFADHVWHLQQTIEELQKALEETNVKAASEAAKLESTTASLDATKSDLAATDSRLTETQAALQVTNTTAEALEKDHEATKAKLVSTDELLAQTTETAKDTKAALETTDGIVAESKAGLEETKERVTKAESNLEKAMMDIGELQKWQASASQEIQQTWTLAEKTSHSLQHQEEIMERKRVDDIEIVKGIHEHLAKIDDLYKTFETTVEAQGKKLEANEQETKVLSDASKKQAEDLQTLEGKADQMAKDIQDILDRLVKVEKTWFPFYETTFNADPNAGRRNIYDIVAELEAIVKKNIQNISALETSQKTQDYWMDNADKRIEELQGKATKLGEKMEATDTEVKDLTKKEIEMATTIGQHKTEIDNTSASLENTIADLKDARVDISGLSKKLAATDGHVAKHAQELATVNEYFNGLRKGIQASIPQHVQKSEYDGKKTDLVKPVKLPMLTPR